MQIYNSSYPDFSSSAVALGNFDGVHIGHTVLLNRLTSLGLPSVVYTFVDHPINTISQKELVGSINTNADKASIFASLGVDAVVFDDFNAVRELSPREFVENILIKRLAVKEAVCGFNYRFGKNGEGNADTLSALLEENGAHLTIIGEVSAEGSAVSSTRIRALISDGDLETASRLLGRQYFVESSVVHGRAIGRQMGVPTVNHAFENGRLIPKYGVYFARCIIDNKGYIAVANVGVRPTVNSTDPTPTLEAHILDFDKELYGVSVKTELYKRVRDEIKFDSLDMLKNQIAEDIANCRKYFNER